MTKLAPYLSIVICGRNDDYGGDFNARLQLSVSWLSYLIEKHQLPTELIIVNYNPILDNASLAQMISWPKREYLTIRLITVPHEIHQRLINPEVRKTVPLFEFPAKNIGIRRAKGEFILCSNADVLFSEGLIAFIAEKRLKKDTFYRSDRLDFKKELKVKLDLDNLDENFEGNIRKNVFEFFVKGGAAVVHRPSSIKARLFILRLRYWLEKYQNRKNNLFNRMFHSPEKLFKKDMYIYDYHCSASGDMALMSNENWQQTRGYLEDTWISTHTDSLHVVSLVGAGLSQRILPHPVYHQHHERRFDFSTDNPDMKKMYARLRMEGNELLNGRLLDQGKNENWGFPDIDFEEEVV